MRSAVLAQSNSYDECLHRADKRDGIARKNAFPHCEGRHFLGEDKYLTFSLVMRQFYWGTIN